MIPLTNRIKEKVCSTRPFSGPVTRILTAPTVLCLCLYTVVVSRSVDAKNEQGTCSWGCFNYADIGWNRRLPNFEVVGFQIPPRTMYKFCLQTQWIQVFTVIRAPSCATMLSVGDPRDVWSRVQVDTAKHLSLQPGDTFFVPVCNRVYLNNSSFDTDVILVCTSIYTISHEVAVMRFTETLGLLNMQH